MRKPGGPMLAVVLVLSESDDRPRLPVAITGTDHFARRDPVLEAAIGAPIGRTPGDE